MQQVELVAVERLFHGVDDDIDLVSGMELGYFIAFADCPAIPLLQGTGHPGRIKMMHRHSPLLGIDARSEHFGGAEQDTYAAGIHACDHRFLGSLRFAFLNETDFRRRDAVIIGQFSFDFAVNVPLVGLVRAQIRENELGTFLPFIFPVIIVDQSGAVRSLVVDMVFVRRRDHPHVERHLSGIVGSDKHLRLFFPIGEFLPTQ